MDERVMTASPQSSLPVSHGAKDDACPPSPPFCKARSAAVGGATGPKYEFWRDTSFLWVLALFSLLLHLATASGYDFFEDELYVLASAKHSLTCCAEIFTLQLWITWLSAAVLGTSRLAVRFLPAVAGSANIIVAGLFARELGGRRFAVCLTGLGVFTAPLLLFAAAMAGTFSYECLLWTCSGLLVVRTLRTGNGRLWWLVGLAWGVAFLAKPPAVLFMLALGLGLLLSPNRGELLRKGYWSALAVALLLSYPILAWQALHGWPILALATRVDEYAEAGFWMAYYSRSKMVLAQPAFIGPLNFALAGLGVFFGLGCGRKTKHWPVLWACIFAGLAFVVTSGHPTYMNPVYSMLIAFGCLAAARLTTGTGTRWLRPVLVSGLMLQGMVIIPLCVPVLPQHILENYSRLVCRGILAPLSSTVTILGGGGESKAWAAKLHRICGALPPQERDNCRIILGYAPTAAVAELGGAHYPLPKVYSPHLNYAFWGPPDESTGTVIAAYFGRKELEGWFGRVEYADRIEDVCIYVCRFPKCGYEKVWREMCDKDWSYRWRPYPDCESA